MTRDQNRAWYIFIITSWAWTAFGLLLDEPVLYGMATGFAGMAVGLLLGANTGKSDRDGD